ncbi:MAG: hypothetical protein ACW98F_09930 [Candidatus Hodarchaeales archaeon]|jgi:hypothetical protein
MKREKPIFAETFFSLGKNRIIQSMYFHYYDSSKIYYNLKKTSAIQGELDSIQSNLQKYIDMDTLHINENLIRMVINSTNVLFRDNDPLFPILIFHVSSTPFLLSNTSLNEIHLYAKPEKIPYSAISCWYTNGNILKVESNSFFRINECQQNVTFFLIKDEVIGDHERIFIQYS